ncbi:MAG: T9SS type A sorting domain-containing protein [Bacteroidales bacterium]|nr:T9SS type A sorting domain-containing protein [Bacteroidales bacterium]
MKKIIFSILFLQIILVANSQNFFTVTVVQDPLLIADAGQNITTCFYDSVQIGGVNTISGGTPPYVISWFPTYGLSDPTIANPMALPDDTTTYTVSITDAHNCTTWSQMTINIDPCSGFNEFENDFSINIFPNPVTEGFLNISLHGYKNNEDFKLSLFSIYGQLILNQDIKILNGKWDGVIDVSSVAKGVYIFETNNNYKSKFEKIVIH